MTGLDKILEQIKADGDKEALALKQECKTKVEEILAQAEADGKQQEALILAKSETECKAIEERAKSSSQLKISNAILSAKQEVIAKTISKGIQIIKTLPEKEYFDLIIKMIKKNYNGKPCEICFGKKDLERMPDDFKKSLKKLDNALTLSDVPVDIDGGFILDYGMIEENCSFDAIFSGLSEQLTDEAAAILFS